DGTHPTQAETLPVAMGGKVVVDQRREIHPLHLLKQQGNVVDALGDDVLEVVHPQSLTQSPIYLQIWAKCKYLVIEVPKGNTAHQAKDKIYYGRSEFETVPLHDSVIRLLMTKAVEPYAFAQIGNVKKVENQFGFCDNYHFEVYVENFGGINIKEFK